MHRGPEETAGLPNEAIKILDEKFHLIRPERRAGATWYELTHDRLIGAIQDSNEKWNAECSDKGKKALSLLQDLDSRWRKGKVKSPQAITLAQQALQVYQHIGDLRGSGLALSYLGAAYAESNLYQEALQSYVESYKLAIYLQLEDQTLQSAFNIVDLLRRKRDYKTAAEFLDHVIERYPYYWTAYAERAHVYLDFGNYLEAIKDYTKALRLDPNNAGLVGALGVCYHRLHQYKQAETKFRRAIQLDPKLAGVHADFAALYVDMGKLEQAEGMYLEALKINPKDVSTLCDLGLLYCRRGKLELARTTYDRAISIDPTSASAYHGLAWVFNVSGDYERAISSFRRALDLAPDWSDALYGLGDAYQRAGKYLDAITTNKKYLRIVPDNVLVCAAIGVCYKKLGDEQAFRQQIDIALSKLSPEWEKRESEHNRACFYAICGKAEMALKLLRTALKKGQLTPAAAWADIDFESLWKDLRFVSLVGPRPSSREPPDTT